MQITYQLCITCCGLSIRFWALLVPGNDAADSRVLFRDDDDKLIRGLLLTETLLPASSVFDRQQVIRGGLFILRVMAAQQKYVCTEFVLRLNRTRVRSLYPSHATDVATAILATVQLQAQCSLLQSVHVQQHGESSSGPSQLHGSDSCVVCHCVYCNVSLKPACVGSIGASCEHVLRLQRERKPCSGCLTHVERLTVPGARLPTQACTRQINA